MSFCFDLTLLWDSNLYSVTLTLFRDSFCVWGGGGVAVKLPPCLKIVRITLDSWNWVRQYTHKFRKYIFYYQEPPNFAEVSIILQKGNIFLVKNSTFTQSNSIRAVLVSFGSAFGFLR